MFIILVMNIHQLDLNLLLSFDAVWRHRSISRAAQELGIAQPTLSNALRRLRGAFDDPLFVRGAGAIMPTPFAEIIAGPIAQGLAAIEQGLQHKAGFDPAISRRRFTIVMTDIAEAVILPQVLKACREIAPDVAFRTVQMPTDAMLAALRAGEVDLLVGYIPGLRGVRRQGLFGSDYVSIVGSRHPAASRGLTLDAFLSARHAVAEAQGTGHSILEKTMLRLAPDLQIGARVPHFLALPMIVGASDMVATVPRPLARLMKEVADIAILDTPLPLPPLPIVQFWHERFDGDPGSRWLRRTLREATRQAELLH
jgi:DNA-binding transcriptional LysR family regulator